MMCVSARGTMGMTVHGARGGWWWLGMDLGLGVVIEGRRERGRWMFFGEGELWGSSGGEVVHVW